MSPLLFSKHHNWRRKLILTSLVSIYINLIQAFTAVFFIRTKVFLLIGAFTPIFLVTYCTPQRIRWRSDWTSVWGVALSTKRNRYPNFCYYIFQNHCQISDFIAWKLVWKLQCHPWPVALVKFSFRILSGSDLKPTCSCCGTVWRIHYQRTGVLPKIVAYISINFKSTSLATAVLGPLYCSTAFLMDESN